MVCGGVIWLQRHSMLEFLLCTIPIPIERELHVSQRGMSFGHGVVDFQSFQSSCLGSEESFASIHKVVPTERNPTVGQSSEAQCVAWILFRRLLEIRNGPPDISFCPLIPMKTTL